MLQSNMRNEYTVKVNIIRHGKTALNERHCYVGVTDDELSDTGRMEISDRKIRGIYPECDKVFISPMKRTAQSAEIMFPEKKFVVIDELREMDFGSFEGKCYDELKDCKSYRRWIDESRGMDEKEHIALYENAENPENIVLPERREKFVERVVQGFKRVLYLSENVDEISIVAHGGTVMSVVSAFSNEQFYSSMVACAEGIKAEVKYIIDDNDNIDVSCFSITGRIHS